MANRPTRTRGLTLQHQQQQSRARWTTPLTEILVNLMVDQVHKGNRKNHNFGKKAWKYMCDEFHKRTGLKWDKEQLKNRGAVLRRIYVTVTSLLDQSDFSWDESTGAIVASDEVWAEYVREHPDAETLKVSGCPIYKELCTIFSEPPTNGKHDHPAEHGVGIQILVHRSKKCPHQILRKQMMPSMIKKQFNLVHLALLASVKEGARMAAASKLRTAATQQHNARYTIANCIAELDKMQGVDEQVYFAALDLFNKPIAREVFLSLKGEKRLIWLLRKCTSDPVL
ncbi:hypothetical protein GBA52_028979 [Prunus armeniaca]|nr:hypothetical protein GBA52_028979 [Prunus armeniaca]